MDCAGSSSDPWWSIIFNPFAWFAVFIISGFVFNAFNKTIKNPLKGFAYIFIRLAPLASIPLFFYFIIKVIDLDLSNWIFIPGVLVSAWLFLIANGWLIELSNEYFSMEKDKKGKWD